MSQDLTKSGFFCLCWKWEEEEIRRERARDNNAGERFSMGSEGVAGSSRVPCVNNSGSNIPAIFPLLSDVAFFMSCFQTHSRGLSGDYALLLVCCVLERNEKRVLLLSTLTLPLCFSLDHYLFIHSSLLDRWCVHSISGMDDLMAMNALHAM